MPHPSHEGLHGRSSYPGLLSKKREHSLDRMSVSPSQGYPEQYVTGIHLYTRVGRDSVDESILSNTVMITD